MFGKFKIMSNFFEVRSAPRDIRGENSNAQSRGLEKEKQAKSVRNAASVSDYLNILQHFVSRYLSLLYR